MPLPLKKKAAKKESDRGEFAIRGLKKAAMRCKDCGKMKCECEEEEEDED